VSEISEAASLGRTCKNRSCNNTVEGRKHYCSQRCQYWERQMVKDDEKGMIPKAKRTRQWFFAYVGSSLPKGQGKRMGTEVKGSMGGMRVPNFDMQEVSKENLDRHFKRPWVWVVEFGDGFRLTRDSYETHGLSCIED
jgi:hypothetical protein